MSYLSPFPAAAGGPAHGPTVVPTPLDDVVVLTGGRPVGPCPTTRVTIVDVTHDSRAAGPGVLFACRPGAIADGHEFAPDAVGRGAAALLVERALDLDVPQVLVDDVASQLGVVAASVHGDPTAALQVVGVTGTNGKTTCATLLDGVLSATGRRTGLIGTVETRIAGETVPGVRTTPESTDLQRLFHRMRDAGVTTVAMEVSSHGLALGRVNGTRFAVAVFTNLTHDHLDFHGSMERYYAAKARLFTPAFSATGVVDIDDDWGRRLAAEATIDVTTVSLDPDSGADVTATRIAPGPAGSVVDVVVHGTAYRLDVGLPGVAREVAQAPVAELGQRLEHALAAQRGERRPALGREDGVQRKFGVLGGEAGSSLIAARQAGCRTDSTKVISSSAMDSGWSSGPKWPTPGNSRTCASGTCRARCCATSAKNVPSLVRFPSRTRTGAAT